MKADTIFENRRKKFELEQAAQISGECWDGKRREKQKSCPLNLWGQDFVMIEWQQVAVGAADRGNAGMTTG